MRWIAAALCLGLAACAAPEVLQQSDKVVTIQHRREEYPTVDALKMAMAACGRTGRVAVVASRTCPYDCVTQYRCE